MKRIKYIIPFVLGLFFTACEDYDTHNNPITYGDSYIAHLISTDKSCYNPGETVKFDLVKMPSNTAKIRYRHFDETIKEESLSSTSWSWTPPTTDYKGYMVDIYETINGEDTIYSSVAVDVSSDWKKFPRYGFLSSYGKMTDSQMNKVIKNISRHHINGIQFYDWMYDHHSPLAGSVENPAKSWPDLMGRINYFSTVKGYVDAAHERGMKAMFYNLAFGVLKNGINEGVSEEWFIYKNQNHTDIDNHHLDPPFRSSIYLTNPANTNWQEYLEKKNKDVYEVFGFDGYHIDQLGDRGSVYDYWGNQVYLDWTYGSFLSAMKNSESNKRLVMNAVNQYGQENSIANSEVDFLYTEVWDFDTYADLVQVILDNDRYSNNTKRTVLAAYMNYDKGSSQVGFINTPGVLMANASIFAFGGAHLEVGEHYLINEYFPNTNLTMDQTLTRSLISYYDFIVAYQNILRDGGEFVGIDIRSADNKINPVIWPAQTGQVGVVGKRFNDKDVMHLINFTDAVHLNWKDTDGTQAEQKEIRDLQISFEASKAVTKIWFASPDYKQGVAINMSYNQNGNAVTVNIPYLKYWDMLVIEY